MKEPPLLIEAKNHKANADALNQCILVLEAKFGVKITQLIDCLSNKQAIEESYKKAPVNRIEILEDGNMEVENNGD